MSTRAIMDSCFLQPTPCLYSHVHALLTNKDAYLACLESLCDKGRLISTTSQAVKARAIAALHIAGQHEHVKLLLPHCDVVEIVKALTLLDRPRRIRQLKRKINKIEENHPHLLIAKEIAKTTPNRRACLSLKNQPKKHLRRRKSGRRRLRRQIQEIEVLGDHHHSSLPCAAAHAHSAVVEMIESSSVSGSMSLKIREWARTCPKLKRDFLEFAVLTMPLGQWKKLADMVHFHQNDFALPYFLSVVHGGALPEDSFVKDTRDMLECCKESKELCVSVFQALAEKHPQIYLNYSFLRSQTNMAHPEIACLLARNIPLGTAIWYLEELFTFGSRCQEIPKIVYERLMSDEDWMRFDSKVTSSFGKLVERILTFQSRKWDLLSRKLMEAAERQLCALKEEWTMYDVDASNQVEARTAVFGDASASMQCAIEAATILATMISVCWNGELSFFHSTFEASPHPRPTTVEQILEICRKVKARGCTSIASALWPYFEQERELDRIVLVTDEGENTNCNAYGFAKLLQAYKKKVNPLVELIVVGVGGGEKSFQKSLTDGDIAFKRIEIDGARPDLSKFDALLGQLAMASGISGATGEEAGAKGDDFVML